MQLGYEGITSALYSGHYATGRMIEPLTLSVEDVLRQGDAIVALKTTSWEGLSSQFSA